MAKHTNSSVVPGVHQYKRAAQNGLVPMAGFLSKVAADFHHSVGRQVRAGLVAERLASIPASAASTTGFWRLILRTGIGQTSATSYIGLAGADSSQDAYLTKVATDTLNGAEVTSSELHYRNDSGSAVSATEPNAIYHARLVLEGLTEDTEYCFRLDTVYVRPVYWLCLVGQQRKVDDSSAGVASPSNLVTDGPIYADDLESLAVAGSQIWRKNGRSLFAFSYNESAKTTTSATYVNALDTSVSAGGANSPGFEVDLANQATRARATVPVVFSVYATGETATNGIKFVDQADNALAEITGFGDGTLPLDPYRSVTAELATSVTKVDMLIKSDGTNDMELYAASMYCYLADPFAIEGGDMFDLVARETVSAGPVPGHTFSSLDGDTDIEYLLKWNILLTGNSTNFRVRPNATAESGTGNTATHRSVLTQLTPAGTSVTTPDYIQLGTCDGGTAPWRMSGWCLIGAAANGPRSFRINAHMVRAQNARVLSIVGGAVWTDASTNITSLQLLNSATDILDDSVFELYKRAV